MILLIIVPNSLHFYWKSSGADTYLCSQKGVRSITSAYHVQYKQYPNVTFNVTYLSLAKQSATTGVDTDTYTVLVKLTRDPNNSRYTLRDQREFF